MERISLRAARVNAGLTQEELANRLGVHRNTIINWEQSPKEMAIKDAERICEILGVSINAIFFENNSTKC